MHTLDQIESDVLWGKHGCANLGWKCVPKLIFCEPWIRQWSRDSVPSDMFKMYFQYKALILHVYSFSSVIWQMALRDGILTDRCNTIICSTLWSMTQRKSNTQTRPGWTQAELSKQVINCVQICVIVCDVDDLIIYLIY